MVGEAFAARRFANANCAIIHKPYAIKIGRIVHTMMAAAYLVTLLIIMKSQDNDSDSPVKEESIGGEHKDQIVTTTAASKFQSAIMLIMALLYLVSATFALLVILLGYNGKIKPGIMYHMIWICVMHGLVAATWFISFFLVVRKSKIGGIVIGSAACITTAVAIKPIIGSTFSKSHPLSLLEPLIVVSGVIFILIIHMYRAYKSRIIGSQ